MDSQNRFSFFDRALFDSLHDFTVIGDGEIGGKAHGLAFAKKLLDSEFTPSEFPEINITIPRLTVITTKYFETFMEQNDLYELAFSDLPDERIAHAFQRAELPPDIVGDLWALISGVKTPLAIRSSSLLEDAKGEPFAGIFGTKMIPNNQFDTRTRFKLLTEAIKFVYASTFFQSAKDYIGATEHRIEEEKMAVIIQEVIGTRYGERFYPHLSGVARSYNFYPFGNSKPEDGIVNLALGLGKTIVDGGLNWSYTPRFPKAMPPYSDIGQLLKETQVNFWTINMGSPPAYDPINETEYMLQATLKEAEDDGTLPNISSTYDAASNKIVMGTGRRGPRIVTFAPILQASVIPLNNVIRKILRCCEESVGCPVELEFAVKLGGKDDVSRFGFLQVRPMVVSNEIVTITDTELSGENVLLTSERALGNGTMNTINTVVYVKPDCFDAQYTPQIASELNELNRQLLQGKTPYLLIGFGRWGSSDSWLGIPVVWSQINGAKVIVEATLEKMRVEVSQGSHFFHNITSFQVCYFSVPHFESAIDWSWLDKQEIVTDLKYVRQVTFPHCLTVKVDGRTGKGVITK